MTDYGAAIGERDLVKPPDLPFIAIGDIAAKGNPAAFRKLFLAFTYSDGESGESLLDATTKASLARPALALQTIAALPTADVLCQDGPGRALAHARPGIAPGELV